MAADSGAAEDKPFNAHDVRFWRRPLGAMIREIKDAGFAIDALVEPQPLPELRGRFPEHWERLTTQPRFLFLRLVTGGP